MTGSAEYQRLYRDVLGALRSCLDAHGPIDADSLSSATKRIVHQILADPSIDNFPVVVSQRIAAL